MRYRILMIALAAVVSVAAGVWAYQWQLDNANIALDNHGYTGGDFTLLSADGEVTLSKLQPTPVLIYFGYAYCPDVCPGSLAVMAAAIKILEAEGLALQGVFISVDPERDSPETLKAYAEHFHPKMLGLTSDQHRILELTTRYGVFYQKIERETGKDYLIDHSSRIYFVNKNGELDALFPHGITPKELADSLRQRL